MEQSTKKKLAIGVSLTILLGVGGYFLWKYLKDKKEQEAKAKADADALAASQNTNTGGNTGGASTQSQIASPFKTTEDIKKFQDWMDSKHPNWVNGKNLNKGGGYGSYGPSTQKAWKSYSSEYTTSTPSTVSTPTLSAIDMLAGDVNSLNGKNVVALYDGMSIFNMNNQASFKTKKGQILGTVQSASKGSNNQYSLTFKTPEGIKYWTLASSVGVKA